MRRRQVVGFAMQLLKQFAPANPIMLTTLRFAMLSRYCRFSSISAFHRSTHWVLPNSPRRCPGSGWYRIIAAECEC